MVNINFKIIVYYFFKLIDFPKTSGKSPFLCVFFKSVAFVAACVVERAFMRWAMARTRRALLGEDDEDLGGDGREEAKVGVAFHKSETMQSARLQHESHVENPAHAARADV